MNQQDPSPRPPSFEPDNLWSARRKRRQAQQQRTAQAEAAAEFDAPPPRPRLNVLIVVPVAAVLTILAGALAVYLMRKPAPPTAAAAGAAPVESWQGSLPEETATGFLTATTHAERMRWVRSPEQVEPLVAAFFKDGPGSREVFAERASLDLPPLTPGQPTHEIARYAVAMTDARKRLLSLVATPQGTRVDFHTYSRHTSAPWPDILEGRAASAEVRLFVAPGRYHAGAFASSDDWLPVTGLCPDVPADLLLYVRRGTPEFYAVEIALRRAPQRVTLTIAPVEESWRERQFQITGFLHEEWYGPAETPPASTP